MRLWICFFINIFMSILGCLSIWSIRYLSLGLIYLHLLKGRRHVKTCKKIQIVSDNIIELGTSSYCNIIFIMTNISSEWRCYHGWFWNLWPRLYAGNGTCWWWNCKFKIFWTTFYLIVYLSGTLMGWAEFRNISRSV